MSADERVPLRTIAREWTRLGLIGFGGPPAHIILLRRLCVSDRGWIEASEFEDAIAATNMLPGPASTQLAIFCAWRVGGVAGALVGGLGFIVPGLVIIIGLSALFLSENPPDVVAGIAAGAGAAVAAVALQAAGRLAPGSWKRMGDKAGERARFVVYAGAGATGTIIAGRFLALVLVGCGIVEVLFRTPTQPVPTADDEGDEPPPPRRLPVIAVTAPVVVGGLAALAWMSFVVGALSFGGGFVIIPLMQHSAVDTYHFMTSSEFLSAVALGQVTPGPVVQTVSAVGYAAAGVGGALLAAAVAFSPSFAFVLGGARHFGRLRGSRRTQAFLTGAGPAAIGAIAGSAIPLGLALEHVWQGVLLGVAAIWLLVLRRGVVSALVGCGVVGALAALAGLPVRA